jgi:hypothetical protein
VYGATVGFTARDPNVFAVSRRISKEALGQDALKLRFVGRAGLQVMVIVQLARDGWPVVYPHRGRFCSALGAFGRCYRTEAGHPTGLG